MRSTILTFLTTRVFNTPLLIFYMFGVKDDTLKIAYYLYQNRNSEKLVEII